MCSFFESLAGPFSTLVSSFNSFLRCADSDGLTFLNFTPFSLCVPVPAVKLRAFKYLICNFFFFLRCVVTMACVCKRNESKSRPSYNAKRFAPAPNYKCTDSLSIRWCSFLERLARPFFEKKKKSQWAHSNFDSFSTMHTDRLSAHL